MKKILIFSFFCLLCFTTSFAQKVKPVNYGGSVNLMEVRGRGGDAVVVLRTLGYGKNDALAQEGSACNPCFALFGFFQGLSGCDFDDGVGGGSEEPGQVACFF